MSIFFQDSSTLDIVCPNSDKIHWSSGSRLDGTESKSDGTSNWLANLATLKIFVRIPKYKIKKLIDDQQYLDKVLSDGAIKAEEIASKKIKEMKQIIGF